MPDQFQEAEKTGTVEPSQHSFGSTHGVSSVSRLSSNYNNRSQQLVGSQKGIISIPFEVNLSVD